MIAIPDGVADVGSTEVAEVAEVAVCLVVPNGTHSPHALAAAIGVHHPSWTVGAIWCGDPQLHPATAAGDLGMGWWDDLDPRAAIERERDLVCRETTVAEWIRALATARELLARGHRHVVLLWVGAIAVLGDVSSLIDGGGALCTVVPMVLTPLPDDELAPTSSDLAIAGSCTTDLLVIHAGGDQVIEALLAGFTGDVPADVGPVLAGVAARFGARELRDQSIGASVWRWADEPALVDLPGFDVEQPWLLAPAMEGAGRIAVVGNPPVAAAVASAAPQLAGRRHALALPGGLLVDRTLRAAAGSLDPATVPAPWTDAAAFRSRIARSFWQALHAWRADLQRLFPLPGSYDIEAFAVWQRRAFMDDDDVSPMIDVVPIEDPPPATTAQVESGGEHPAVADLFRPATALSVERPLRADGLNLVGYLTRDASLGDVARRLWASLDQVDLPVASVATHRTASPVMANAPSIDQTIRFETTLAVVTADQFPMLALDHPELLRVTRRMIGYWFWELELVPAAMRAGIDLVDEIWVGSQFVQDAFAAVTTKSVHLVPIPVPEPSPSSLRRADFPALADLEGRFVFLVVFDHLSIAERKNPVGAIEAFRRAFPARASHGEGPVLVVKSMHADVRWRQQQRILSAADGHPDIRFWDGHVERADLMAAVRDVDCLVSLHRSEGLGLHLAEAMWLGTPTIATRYSGNLDFMDDGCSMLVDAGRIAVGRGGQGVYPPTAMWADPDLDQAADAMSQLVVDRSLHGRLASSGVARMRAQPSLADTGRLIAELLGLATGAPAGAGTVSVR